MSPVRILQISEPLEAYMIVNFKINENNRDMHTQINSDIYINKKKFIYFNKIPHELKSKQSKKNHWFYYLIMCRLIIHQVIEVCKLRNSFWPWHLCKHSVSDPKLQLNKCLYFGWRKEAATCCIYKINIMGNDYFLFKNI